MENFRSYIKDFFDLEVLKFLGLPSLAFDAFLKSSGVEIELVHCRRMVQMLEAGLKGGVRYFDIIIQHY